ncbi:MAG TPA: calcium/sodium antiporter [Rhodothermales bacterium]|nr:calcium/sodium antiporter [Rhodothermales bacterium]
MASLILPLGLLISGIGLLWIGAEGLVRSSETLAIRSGVSPLVTGLTVVAFGTSAPEMLASITAALYGSGDLAIGNVIGSNISNIGLVLGLAAVVSPIVIHRRVVRVDAPLALGCTVVLIAMLYNDILGRLEGIILLVGIIAYVAARVRNARVLGKELAQEVTANTLSVSNPTLAALMVASLAALAVGSFLFVDGARNLALQMGVTEAVIGLTIMAVGTSLPEIATVVAAARKGLSDLVIGNVVGSNIFNILSVLGVAATVIPLERQDVDNIDLLVFGGSAAVLLALMMRASIGKATGAALMAGYAVYVGFLYLGA